MAGSHQAVTAHCHVPDVGKGVGSQHSWCKLGGRSQTLTEVPKKLLTQADESAKKLRRLGNATQVMLVGVLVDLQELHSHFTDPICRLKARSISQTRFASIPALRTWPPKC